MGRKINVLGIDISIISKGDKNFVSLTDMIRNIPNGSSLIEKWLRNKNTNEFLGEWEYLYNPDFNSLEFDVIKNESGTNRFLLSVKKWIEKTMAISQMKILSSDKNIGRIGDKNGC